MPLDKTTAITSVYPAAANSLKAVMKTPISGCEVVNGVTAVRAIS